MNKSFGRAISVLLSLTIDEDLSDDYKASAAVNNKSIKISIKLKGTVF